MLLMAVGFGLESVGVYYSFSGALLCASALLIVAFRKVLKNKEASFST